MINVLFKAFRNFKILANKAPVMDSYIWIDLEMSGLDIKKHTILEVACIITTPDLKLVHQGISFVINQPEDVLKSINSWSAKYHEQSGLIAQSRESKISITEADELISSYIKNHTNPQGERYLAGNSVYMDKRFLEKYMPSVDNLLHYRLVDVSSLKVLCRYWYPEAFSKFKQKNLKHRAFDDIVESINELKEYQKVFFKTEV